MAATLWVLKRADNPWWTAWRSFKLDREAFEGKDVKIKLQEASLAWLTLPDAAPTA